MPTRSGRLLRHLRRLTSPPNPGTDAELLGRFVRARDEDAFAALVTRHGGLVLGVCRRVLRDLHRAEDAFQAVWLVLARKAATVHPAEGLAAWLYGVARLVARNALRGEGRRRSREAAAFQAPTSSPPDPLDELTARELLAILDEEVARLPEAHRLAVIYCGLEGLSQEEAAGRLGWTPGQLKGRLERGRARLQARLARRGLTLPAALGAVELARTAARAALGTTVKGVSHILAGEVSAEVLGLMKGALRDMLRTRLKLIVTSVLGVSLLGIAAGLFALHAAQNPSPPGARTGTTAQAAVDEPTPAQGAADRVYDVADIVAKGKSWGVRKRPEAAGQGEDAAEELARRVLESLIQSNPDRAKKFLGKRAAYHVQLLNGNRLEVRADRATHEQVKEFLEAFRGSLDQAVVVTSYLYEVDRAAYGKAAAREWARQPGEPPVFVVSATEENERILLGEKKMPEGGIWPLFKGHKPLRKIEITIPHRERREIFSWRTAVPYEKGAGRASGKGNLAVAFPGFSFSAMASVSRDRRKVEVKLTQSVTQLAGWEKVEAVEAQPDQELKPVVFEAPLLREFSFTSTFVMFDGASAVVPVQWRRPGVQGERTQLLLLLCVRILIEAEEKEIRRREALEKDKRKR
jgi:RNA polymerase sigma factor (sigma-70 family)